MSYNKTITGNYKVIRVSKLVTSNNSFHTKRGHETPKIKQTPKKWGHGYFRCILARKFYVRRKKNKVNSIKTGQTVISPLFSRTDQ